MWSRWTATESWAALVDDDGFGLGIWSPGVCSFNGGFSGKPGAGGPQDNPTGYMTPSPREIIDWNIDHTYRYDLIVGKLDEIRKHVYEHASKPAPPAYRFEKDRQGWSYANAVDAGWPIQGELNVKIEQDDPQLLGPISIWQAADAANVVIEAASHSQRSDGRLYWQHLGDKGFSDQNSVAFTLNGDSDFHVYRIPLKDNAAWAGAIVQLRFDPIGAGAKGEWIRVKSIAVEK